MRVARLLDTPYIVYIVLVANEIMIECSSLKYPSLLFALSTVCLEFAQIDWSEENSRFHEILARKKANYFISSPFSVEVAIC